jgi:hypothetical protein
MSSSSTTHYSTLGIDRDANADEVRCAWKKLVQQWHPDRFPEGERADAEARASEINAAFHVLRDSGRRAAYDCRLAADEAAAEAAVKTRRAHRVDGRHGARVPTHPSDRVGAPHVHAVSMSAPEPWDAERVVRELVQVVRRHPKLIAAVCGVWVTIVGATVAWSAVTGPSLPANTAQHRSLMAMSSTHDSDLASMRKLTEQMKQDAAAADAQAQQQLREDAANQARLEAEADAQARADFLAQQRAAKLAAAAAKKLGTKGAAAAPKRHVVRVLPQA